MIMKTASDYLHEVEAEIQTALARQYAALTDADTSAGMARLIRPDKTVMMICTARFAALVCEKYVGWTWENL